MNAERLYRLALTAYPAGYRADREEEMLGVLMAAGDGPSWGEAAALVRHGLARRLSGASGRGAWTRAGAAAAMALATALAGVALEQLVEWGVDRTYTAGGVGAWVDPAWPAYLLWLLTFGLLLTPLRLLAVVTAWGSAGVFLIVGLQHLVHGPGWRYGDLQQNWATLSLVVPAAVLALLLLHPGVGRRAVSSAGGRSVALATAAGVLPTVIGLREGISGAWPVILVLGVNLVRFVGRGVFLRAGLLLGFAFVYVPLGALTDGSGSRLPHDPQALGVTLAVLPLLVALVGAVVIPFFESSTLVRRAAVRGLEHMLQAVRSD